ncbi:hypothetical protein EGH22_20465 [Halomicroarcula sp. F28]|uniref:hypothetical protein n=1 Tax=Haloarcula salinisoli TaxID=2487746 RepID=UPI001C73D7E0|nr:hypothetical protein [Halomicroarcula salinisoli]MBX0288708.1 hypothetical protein [Halomicroarcula salinisoli]
MPFRARIDGEIVAPAQVEDHNAVECPKCGGVLYPRDGENLARHFVHYDDSDSKSCTAAGESDTHARCTALAVAALDKQFPDASRAGAEITINVEATETNPDKRRADAFIAFEDENPYFGAGLIIEIQHKHHSKDIEGTTHDYLSAGYSVAWLTPYDFEEEYLDYENVNEAFQSESREAYNIREYEPWEFETKVGSNLDWEPPSLDCLAVEYNGEHYWKKVPAYAHPKGHEYEICHDCGLRRTYDQELTRYVYDSDGVLAPDYDIDVLRDAVVLHPELEAPFDEWIKQGGSRYEFSFDRCLIQRTEVAPCRGPYGVHEWSEPKIIDTKYNGDVGVELRNCQHCPAHVLTNYTDHGETEATILFGKAPDPDWGLESLNGNPRQCTFRPHYEEAEWDYCPKCMQSNVNSVRSRPTFEK